MLGTAKPLPSPAVVAMRCGYEPPRAALNLTTDAPAAALEWRSALADVMKPLELVTAWAVFSADTSRMTPPEATLDSEELARLSRETARAVFDCARGGIGAGTMVIFLLGYQRSFEAPHPQNTRHLRHVRRKEDVFEITDFSVLKALDERRPDWFAFVESFFIATRLLWPSAHERLVLLRKATEGSPPLAGKSKNRPS